MMGSLADLMTFWSIMCLITKLVDCSRVIAPVLTLRGETSFPVEVLGGVAVLGVRGDESDKHDDTSHVEELGDFGDAADVLSAVLSGEAETLVTLLRSIWITSPSRMKTLEGSHIILSRLALRDSERVDLPAPERPVNQ